MKAPYSLQNKMGSQPPKAAGGNAIAAVRTLPSDVDRDAVGSSWRGDFNNNNNPDATSHEDHRHLPDSTGTLPSEACARANGSSTPSPSPRPTPTTCEDIPDALFQLLINMFPGHEGQELAEAFRDAWEFPPITRQSLSELDIQSIIVNSKLRHDINFDRDLSFRPNLDGLKGQEKKRSMTKYYRALVAELELYARLFQGSPALKTENVQWSKIVQHAQRRIPKMFETIKEILKSLVPERDHSRIDEHLDVPMLMQEIERGVCDLVRLAEWMSHLLKEHCAPMRDWQVDEMVLHTRSGVFNNSSEDIVKGLSDLLGILEAMKLDVANHQIRNLKTLLIEDTLNFERHYHLDKLVKGQPRINLDGTQKWYAGVLREFRQQCTPAPRDVSRFQVDVFTRAIVSILFSRSGPRDFPETFYLDQDRLRVLKCEINDLIFFDICLDLFTKQLRQFGYDGPISSSIRHQLRSSLTAIIGDAIGGRGLSAWTMNAEPLSLEILRQALALAGHSMTFNYEDLQKANNNLRVHLVKYFLIHASKLENEILPQILSLTARHLNSSPLELFNNLITHPTPPPARGFPTFLHHSTDTSPSPSSAYSEQFSDISNRIAHIILLHWRVWGSIAYVQDDDDNEDTAEDTADESSRHNTDAAPTPKPHASCTAAAAPHADADAQVLTRMQTGDTPDPAQETQLANRTSLP